MACDLSKESRSPKVYGQTYSRLAVSEAVHECGNSETLPALNHLLLRRKAAQFTFTVIHRLTTFNMENSKKYTVSHLAVKNPVAKHHLEKFKTLRLEAIRLESAITAYNDEPSFTDEEWVDRMTSPTHHHLICEHVRHELREREKPELGLSAASENEWVGMFTLRGPLSQEQYDFEGRQGPSLGNDEEETRWYLFGLYLRSEHRGTEMNTEIHEALSPGLDRRGSSN